MENQEIERGPCVASLTLTGSSKLLNRGSESLAVTRQGSLAGPSEH